VLIVTRKAGQSVMVGDTIRISIVEVRGKQIRLGVDAPNELPILREEVFIQVQEENRQAASVRPDDLNEILDIIAVPDEAGGNNGI
jgi:carbon storage regulator